MSKSLQLSTRINRRFGGMLPVVVDVETGGLHAATDALLEIAVVLLAMDRDGMVYREQTFSMHILPFEGARLDPAALEITGIDPYHPFRFAVTEEEALNDLFNRVAAALDAHYCQRAVLVGHNATFDLGFIQAAMRRCHIKRSPFHNFTVLDTATICAMFFGQTVLAKAAHATKIGFNPDEAHSAIYDAEKTADLFCYAANLWQQSYQSAVTDFKKG